MRLTHLKLAGFKSFVEPTLIPVGASRVGVVGPNGCGKSNVIDAVRWVLGESQARQLRGQTLDDVIFNGSHQRKPLSRVSVELVFDNSLGRLAGAWGRFSEISVKRVLERNGESVYALNNQTVRRRDVTDLFAGTGVNAYAIVEQGTISRLIEARPEELRGHLEEAAGIARYKDRRRETEARLRDARENLARLSDLRGELDAQIGRLQAQAAGARTYRRLEHELRTAQHTLWWLRESHAAQAAARLGRELQGLDLEAERETAALRAAEAALEAGRAEFDRLGDAARARQGEAYAANAELARAEQRLLHLRESRARVSRELDAATEREKAARAGHALALERQAGLTAESEAARSQRDQAEGQLAEARAVLPDLESELRAAQQELSEARGRLAGAEEALKIARVRAQNAHHNHAQATARRERLGRELERLPAPAAAELAGLQVAAEAAAARAQAAEAAVRNAETALPRSQQAQTDADRAWQALQKRRAQVEARRDALARTLPSQAPPQALADWLARHGLRDAPPLAALLRAEPGWETAVETALGEWLRARAIGEPPPGLAGATQAPPAAGLSLVFRDVPPRAPMNPTAGSMPEIGTRVGGQGVAHVPPATDAAFDATSPVLEAAAPTAAGPVTPDAATPGAATPGVIAAGSATAAQATPPPVNAPEPRTVPLAERVRARAPQWQAAVEALCAGFWAADDLTHALALRPWLPPGGWAVTPQGHRVSAAGVHFPGARADAGLLARAREVDDLAAEGGQLASEEAALRQAAETAAAASAAATRELGARREAARAAREQAHALQLQTAKLTESARQAEGRRGQIGREVSDAAAECERLGREAAGFDGQADAHARAAAEARPCLDAAAERRRALEAQLARAREATVAAGRVAQEAEFRERATAEKLAETAERLQALAAQAEAEAVQTQRLRQELAGLDEAGLSEAMARALSAREQASAAQAAADAALQEAGRGLRAHDETRLRAERQLHALRDQAEQTRLKLQEATLRRAHWAEQLDAAGADRDGLSLAEAREPALEKTAERLRAEITQLGAVNLAAVDELEQAEARAGYLDAQAQDLGAAMQSLEEAIRRIDRDTRERLRATFAAVNQSFAELFVTLFGGGRAELALTGDEILDAGVLVTAQPPGKRNGSIHLLSGGEKALTAMALVFALFRLNPAPFCLLDEVDAPLDDRNTQRFCDLIRHMSRDTQFLFISHNRISMEMAEQLIGITMQEPGVSRTVAVDLNEATRLTRPAAPAGA